MIVVGMNPLVTIFAAVGFAAAKRINKSAEKGEDQNGSFPFLYFNPSSIIILLPCLKNSYELVL
jgi:hypothetical protein